MKFAQVFLFFLSCIALFLMVFFLLRSQTVAIITTLIYGSTPVGCGFLYYSISESITPAILIIGVFLSLNTFHFVTIKNRLFFIILSAVFMAFLIIVRPVLLLFTIFPPLIILLQKDSIIKRKILSSICTLVIILLPISLWQLRNYKISNQWVGLHPIYYPESNSLFTPAHGAVWNFASAYGTKPAVFHGYMVPLWDNTINGDTSQKIINDILTTIPRDVRMSLGEENIYSALLKYRSFLILQKNYLDNNKALPVQLPDKEIEAITAFNTLTNAYKRQFFFHYYVLTPLSVIGDMCCNSNLSMYMFQKSFRGNTIMELFRWIATGLRLICFILVIPALFFYKKIPEKLLFGLFPLLYILFLAMVIRGVEERYLLPIWPLLIINFGMFVQLIYSRYFVKTKEEPL